MEEGVKWAYSSDGKIRFTVPMSGPDVVQSFCYQPERSKREDPEGELVYIEPNVEGWTLTMGLKYEQCKDALECGALNIVETQ